MSTTDHIRLDETDAIVTLPMNAVDSATSTTTRLIGEHGMADSLNKFAPSSAGRSESFPCTKKSHLEDQIIVSSIQEGLPASPTPAIDLPS